MSLRVTWHNTPQQMSASANENKTGLPLVACYHYHPLGWVPTAAHPAGVPSGLGKLQSVRQEAEGLKMWEGAAPQLLNSVNPAECWLFAHRSVGLKCLKRRTSFFNCERSPVLLPLRVSSRLIYFFKHNQYGVSHHWELGEAGISKYSKHPGRCEGMQLWSVWQRILLLVSHGAECVVARLRIEALW